MVGRLLAGGLTAALLLAGCWGADDPAPARLPPDGPGPAAAVSPSPDQWTVSCAHDIGGTAPDPTSYRVVLDAVALPSAVLEPHESGEPGWLFAKHGLLVRAGTEVAISVPPEWAAAARIGWGSPGPEGTRILVPACRGGRSGWLAFAGGYTVRKPACLPLLVRVDEREERTAVSVGVAC
ncbi:hypothetical protein [Actinoplanes aureus]|uniref:Lipoprotein n=1 Tax=Actinoplanes aureus TaxID=2792083 RepID=A0A931CDM0_9ACTN|nr:hypothetical protein [Actinoplanes aureus]MBG0564611.1 hypothetical protein [Actinoplanes aureus]